MPPKSLPVCLPDKWRQVPDPGSEEWAFRAGLHLAPCFPLFFVPLIACWQLFFSSFSEERATPSLPIPLHREFRRFCLLQAVACA